MEELQIEQRYLNALFQAWLDVDDQAELSALKVQSTAVNDAFAIIRRIAAE